MITIITTFTVLPTTNFQESNYSFYKNMYSKMQGFIADGHDVLSANNTYQLEQVKAGKYAYMVDMTAAQYFVAENCGCAIAPDRFLPFQYTVALQLNSAYTDDISQL